MDASISAATLRQSIRSSEPPLVIDVRRNEMLEHGMVIYDALYAWCKQQR